MTHNPHTSVSYEVVPHSGENITYFDIMIFHKNVITKTLTTMSNVAYCINPLRASDLCNLGWPLCNICVTNDHGYVPLVVNTIRSFPHSWLITGFVTRLTRWVSLVEQELPTLPEHLSSPPVLSRVRVTRSLVLRVFCRSLFVLWFTDYDYPFGIFKLFQ